MTSLKTKLYASQNNGGKASASIQDIGNLLGSTAAPATTSTLGVVKQATDVTALTDSTGGTATSTLAAITAGAAYAQADAVATKNALASLAANNNAILAALKAAGIMA